MPQSEWIFSHSEEQARSLDWLQNSFSRDYIFYACTRNNKRSGCWCRQLHETDMYCLAKLFLLTEATNKNSAAAIMPANEMRPAKQPILQPHFPIWRIALFSRLRQQTNERPSGWGFTRPLHWARAYFFQLSFQGHFDFHPWSLHCNERPLSDGWPTHTGGLFTRSDWTLVFPSYFGSLPNR